MSAWGKTGRVTIHSGSTRGVYNDIHVDGEHVGNADHLPSGWQARAFDGKYGSAEAPSLDAAVLWVLRRVDPALWRQERGEVGTLQIADDVWMLQAPGHPSWTLRRWPHDPAGWTWGEALSALINETKDALR